jgi:uncharacterized membrane protein YgcG
MNWVSDTINDSRLSWPTNHAIVFRVPQGVPASGRIEVAFENASFFIDPSFSYADVDLAVSAVSPSSGFVERSLAPVEDSANDSVLVTPITGPITITLASGSGIPAGSYVRILLGTNAPGGTYQITNPGVTASYRILLNTYDTGGGALDYGAAMVAILPAIGVSANTDIVSPAVLSNGMPSGTIPSNISGVLVSFNTNLYAACRYATSPGTFYDAMTNNTTADWLGTFHTFSVTGITRGTTYTYYVRCVNYGAIKNPDDYVISFTAGDPTGTGLGGGTGGSTGSSGGGGGGGGGGAPYPPGPASPSLTITGVTLPNVNISILEDGSKINTIATADGSGNFSLNIPSLSQGTYSFTIQAVNGSLVPLASYTATITLVAGTANSITGVVLPPSIGFATSTVAIGKRITISGESAPLSMVDLIVASQTGLRNPFETTTTASGAGDWSYVLNTAGFPMDTYQVKARAFVTGLAASNFSSASFLGIGQTPVSKLAGDLNGDGKINLVDFSVMLVHWGASYAPDDLNSDGTVDLPDLSILLSHWTG